MWHVDHYKQADHLSEVTIKWGSTVAPTCYTFSLPQTWLALSLGPPSFSTLHEKSGRAWYLKSHAQGQPLCNILGKKLPQNKATTQSYIVRFGISFLFGCNLKGYYNTRPRAFESYLLTVGNESAQNLRDLWHAPLLDRSLYGPSMGNVTRMILDTSPSHFSHAKLKIWEGLGTRLNCGMNWVW